MKFRFIKLGRKGAWEQSCINENTIRLDYISPYHKESLSGDWDAVHKCWLDKRKGNKSTATSDVRQIKDFYDLEESDVWITFYKRNMYWCRASKEVIELDDGSRIRRVIGEWSNKNKAGDILSIENIDGRVTKVQGYQGTICEVKKTDYLLRKINGEVQPEIENTQAALIDLKEHISTLITGLWWNDFELLIDLIFSKLGWQRISVLGKTEKDIDLDVFSPVNQKRAFVQIKSSSNYKEAEKYCALFSTYEQYDEMYFVYHTFKGSKKDIEENYPRVHFWDISRISDLVINAGLIDWLIAKRT
jgi:hypothetical protein